MRAYPKRTMTYKEAADRMIEAYRKRRVVSAEESQGGPTPIAANIVGDPVDPSFIKATNRLARFYTLRRKDRTTALSGVTATLRRHRKSGAVVVHVSVYGSIMRIEPFEDSAITSLRVNYDSVLTVRGYGLKHNNVVNNGEL